MKGFWSVDFCYLHWLLWCNCRRRMNMLVSTISYFVASRDLLCGANCDWRTYFFLSEKKDFCQQRSLVKTASSDQQCKYHRAIFAEWFWYIVIRPFQWHHILLPCNTSGKSTGCFLKLHIASSMPLSRVTSKRHHILKIICFLLEKCTT